MEFDKRELVVIWLALTDCQQYYKTLDLKGTAKARIEDASEAMAVLVKKIDAARQK